LAAIYTKPNYTKGMVGKSRSGQHHNIACYNEREKKSAKIQNSRLLTLQKNDKLSNSGGRRVACLVAGGHYVDPTHVNAGPKKILKPEDSCRNKRHKNNTVST